MHLPEQFKEKMKSLLKDEYEDFIKSYDDPKVQGLRLNPLKIDVNRMDAIPFHLKKVPWSSFGYSYEDPDRPGKHPYHEAGLYYIQEPSAMAVGELVAPLPGEKVLDLCAAPGGKSTHLASFMNGEGLLITNEIHPARAKILSQNIERLGIKNALVLNETPEKLATHFENFFDRILVDAPCSGEGMFRKDEGAVAQWSHELVDHCSLRQRDIIDHAASMLKSGGRLVYSTCTFSPQENEQVIEAFITRHPDFEAEDVTVDGHLSRGRVDWSKEHTQDVTNTFRLWPHRLKGEGHYVAVLKKNGEPEEDRVKELKHNTNPKLLKDYFDFAKETLNTNLAERLLLFGQELYQAPESCPDFSGLKVLRPGFHLGTLKKNRFEPSHALALGLKMEEVSQSITLKSDSPEILSYLKGETLTVEHGLSGWTLVLVDDYSIGWGKVSNGILKNHYPKGLRWF